MLACVPQNLGGGQASNLRGKQLENWGAPGSEVSLAPRVQPSTHPRYGGNERESWIRGGCQQGTGLGTWEGGTGRWRLGNLPQSPLLNPKISQHHTALWSPIPPLPKTR